MKKVFALAVVLGLAACAPKAPATPAADTSHAAAPAPMDSSMKADSTKKDTAQAMTAPATAPAAKPAH